MKVDFEKSKYINKKRYGHLNIIYVIIVRIELDFVSSACSIEIAKNKI